MLDTNVLLAGFGTSGLYEALISVCQESHHLIVSQHLLPETQRYVTTKFESDDLPVRGTAVAGLVSLLVTGDQDLLVLSHSACRQSAIETEAARML